MLTPTATDIRPQDRATPRCPHFGPCGGCQLQHLTYDAQLALKAEHLRTLLEATGLVLPELELHASPPFGYRNRVRLTLAEVDGKLRAGYLTSPSPAPANLNFLPITDCPIAAPILWRTAQALLALLNQDGALWLRSPQFKLDQLELFTAADESGLLLTLYLRTAAKSHPAKLSAAFTTLCESLRVPVPELKGAGIAILPPASAQRSRRTEVPKPGPTWGAPGLNYSVSQLTTDIPQPVTSYWIPRGAFFQINRFMLPELLALVTANRAGQVAWDLYAGVGLFTRALSSHFNRITAVEIAGPAFTALASSKLPNLHGVKATTLDFLRSAVTQRDRPELIVLDPPRTGAGSEICTLLGRIAAPTLVYVSCSPETLPSDLQTLTTPAASGYRIAELHLLDLFPQTTHIETIAILTR